MDLRGVTGVATAPGNSGTALAVLVDEAFEEFVREKAFEISKQPGADCARQLEHYYTSKAVLIEKLLALRPSDLRAFGEARDKSKKLIVLKVLLERLQKAALQLPESWIRTKAYELYEYRGWQHGLDKQDWFQAKSDLYETFSSLYWHDRCDANLWTCITAKTLKEALLLMDRFRIDPDMVLKPPQEKPPQPPLEKEKRLRDIRLHDDTAGEFAREDGSPDPLALLSVPELDQYRGQAVAIIINGPQSATVIASGESREELHSNLAKEFPDVAKLDWCFCEVPLSGSGG